MTRSRNAEVFNLFGIVQVAEPVMNVSALMLPPSPVVAFFEVATIVSLLSHP